MDAVIGSGYVILYFPLESTSGSSGGAPSALLVAIDLYLAGGFECAKRGFLCVADETVDEKTRQALYSNWRAEDLRRNQETRRPEPKKSWGNRSGPDDRPQARGQHRTPPGHPPSDAEVTILAQIQSMVDGSRSHLSHALSLICPKPTRFTFRASLHNPQHLVPFPFLSSVDIERYVGEAVSAWLDAHEVENREGWKELCEHAARDGGGGRKKGRLWKVELKESEVDVGIRMVSVAQAHHERTLHFSDTSQPYGGHIPRKPFPETIRMLITMSLPGPQQQFTPLSGRTALSFPAAHLLAFILPTFSPFIYKRSSDIVLIDPCSGTGAIPRQLVRMGQLLGRGHLILCGDYVPENASAAMRVLADRIPSPAMEFFVWTAQGIAGGLRDGVVDGIISDLPWGHREGTPKLIEKLYPAFLATFGKMTEIGCHAVLTTSAKPLMKRCLARSKYWKEIGVGGEGATGEREVWLGGMRASVFLLQRV
ncbi:hypothetical protein FRB95_014312 [Tulasnella sp. JGI-2019a]|nr:hypothetical protein FRB95_014312 [Tulasnella sp. JGI-2019a]